MHTDREELGHEQTKGRNLREAGACRPQDAYDTRAGR
jgi:hypothetical protein